MADIFYKKNSSSKDIFDAGEQCTLILYGASKSDNDLNKYRYKCFVRGVSKRRKMSLAFLPPTDDSARQHFKRVYLQVQQCCKSGCENNCGCKKTGLYCSTACLTCSGVDCLNAPPIEDIIETDTVGDVQDSEETDS
ncbi:PREDICTED: uncharacterized protein LOC108757424 [Trachymyrmex cornetzi]|uniref:uncharacterized protein LOC108757424 n=1 Tax=Trachymyrmex cornetzi TaxID=471704 RepID=UPI00084ED46E|nr:PREDICTED: uncharacterized protein LOC108757424 [Trachymyrmex cornetzi]